MKYPKKLGECIDLLFLMRKERLDLAKHVDAAKEKEAQLQNHILKQFKKTELDGGKGKIATCAVSTSTVPTVKDWGKVYSYIQKNKAFDLLERRISVTAFRERLDAKQSIPGVETFNVVKLSLTKAAKK